MPVFLHWKSDQNAPPAVAVCWGKFSNTQLWWIIYCTRSCSPIYCATLTDNTAHIYILLQSTLLSKRRTSLGGTDAYLCVSSDAEPGECNSTTVYMYIYTSHGKGRSCVYTRHWSHTKLETIWIHRTRVQLHFCASNYMFIKYTNIFNPKWAKRESRQYMFGFANAWMCAVARSSAHSNTRRGMK